MDAYSPEIIGTLETLIVPGKQVRISPYVEAMQFQRLFGESPDPKNRFESARAILDANQKKVAELVEIWGDFVNGEKKFRAEIYDDGFLDAYLAYYLTVNVGKLQILFLELLRQRLLPPRFSLLDVGIASGTTFTALLDFVAAWESVCLLHDTVCPIESIEMIGVDAQPSCLNYSRQAVTTLVDLIAASDTSGLPFTAWAKESRWIEQSIGQAPLEIPKNPTLFVCSNILSEDGMEGQGHATIEQAVRNLPHQSIILLLEPGDKPRSIKLNQWRVRLLNDDPALHLVGPCGQEYESRVPQHCGSCWNARRESLHRPLLYQRFCEEAEKQPQGGNPKWQVDHENHLLSWSYLCFVRSAAWQIPQTPSIPPGGILTRFIGRYRANQTNQYHPAADSETIPVASETIKFCPAICGDQYKALTLGRVPGFVMPLMAFGQTVQIQGAIEQDSVYLRAGKVRAESVQPVQMDTPSDFLTAYSATVRRGIDSVAYRLFGFPGMREFQHQILERVLTGKSIFGIAATGGGKSECFILPAMLLPGMTVVISPLKSLMQDQYDQRLCARYGLDTLATFINSSISFQEKETRIRRMELGYYKLVYLTPEQCVQTRILDSLRRADQAVGFRYLALDEAHCISHWGHDFRPAYLNLLARINQHQLQPVRIALTATASQQVRRDICDELSLNRQPLEQGGDLFVYSANRPELNLIVKFTGTVREKVEDLEARLKRLLRDNQSNRCPGAAIIFMPHTGPGEATSTNYKGERQDFSGRRTVAHFASHLERALHKRVGIYHGKMEDNAEEVPDTETPSRDQGRITALPHELGEIRDRNRRDEQERFIRGDTDIMVATKGFGMGIDKPNIRLVLHHSTPGNLEAYTQEAGRAGRDGDFADVVLYFSPQPVGDASGQGQSDSEIQRFFLDQKYVRELDVRAIRHFLKTRVEQADAFHLSGRLYFTADEVISHFNQIMAKGYSWPDFPPRQPARGWESPDHRLILDRGHDYENRVNLITRILSVCYEIRPLVDGHRVSLLDRVDSVGSFIKGARIENANAILASNPDIS
ncbi:hypothetical protein CCR95_18750 [Thiocystis minor]|uniref:DEAD/DEAH box helicase n=1 Tax=Thiocystis minor TaxID=61597 RepID=UPI001911B6F5|nr:DEAD/DEAH box helicase [Thiocystis minor]MBK5966061.1 hypothetical protein [Thiocystis minor]